MVAFSLYACANFGDSRIEICLAIQQLSLEEKARTFAKIKTHAVIR
jgi:hypothetical protein